PEFVVKWEYPLMIRDEEADPKALKQIGSGSNTGGAPKKADLAEVVGLLSDGSKSRKDWQDECKDKLGISMSTFKRYLKEIRNQDLATFFQGRWYKPGSQMVVSESVPEYKASIVLKY